MKKTQELIEHARLRLETIYEEPEATSIAFALIGHVLNLSRLELSMQRHDLVNHEAEAKTEKLISRLLQHEPLQYVLGTAHFYDLELNVSPAVLIPRPETEELVSLIIKGNQHKKDLHVLDVGTGSGCIALALAEYLHTEKVYGLDVSPEALEVAHSNSLKYGQPIEWLQANVFEDKIAIKPHTLDLLVSNPPYVLENEKMQMRRNVLDHEPHLALFVPDTDALRYYKRIADVGRTLLKPGGTLYFEINEQFGLETVAMLQEKKFSDVQLKKDLFDKDRFVTATFSGLIAFFQV